ncbi:hypothetical protein QUA20_30590 [Microcoleus sp. Pol7_A1]|uniref:hypothetical protein n=1 Tax=Microcoleus sp. Pol7_A1 TaxID=2818893 RepID=UPI002FD4D81A
MGLWKGSYQNQTQQWLRWWDSEGNWLLTGRNKPAQEREGAQAQGPVIDRQQQQKERLTAYWRLQAIDPDLI